MSEDTNGSMSACERFEKHLEGYLSGDIPAADLAALRDHAETCPECRKLMELHGQLLGIPDDIETPSDGDLREMRTSVMRRIARSRPAPRPSSLSPWARWRWALTSKPAYSAGLAAACLILGFVLGRVGTREVRFDEDLFIKEVEHQASLERGLSGYWDSPFVYSNVDLRPQDDGTVKIDFDVTHHVSVARALDSPLAREILVYAMIDPSPMGMRLTAMGAAQETMDDKLREALIFILLNDPSLPVRLRSLEILAKYAADPAVQDALLKTISQDPSVQVRLLALDSLADERRDPGAIRRALGEPLDENDRAVLHRAIELVGES
jgi:hypothetical protein